MRIKQYQVDAFTANVFEGNPAAVCPLEYWLADDILLAIAAENNLSETAFFVPSLRGFHLRWFTPTTEVSLCGHATLASAHVIFETLGYLGQSITFETLSGDIRVVRNNRLLEMDFPSIEPKPCFAPPALLEGLGHQPTQVLCGEDYIIVYENENIIRSITPNYIKFLEIDLRGVVITAPGIEIDFVSRFFAPKLGIYEDPVTGSTHCELAPYWGARLDKKFLNARQISKRGGEIWCELRGSRVAISGQAITFMEAEIIF